MGKLTNLNPAAPIADADIPAAIARDSETTAAINAHVGATDPHPIYLTQAEGDGRYRQISTALTDTDIPAAIARDAEYVAADDIVKAFALSNFFKRSVGYNVSINADNPDNHDSGLKANDAYVDGILSGWHFFTSLRPDNSNFGIQIAFADIYTAVYYRKKTSGSWQAWVKIV